MGRNVTDVGVVPTKEKKELKKHAATIHCSNSLSLLQRKVSNALLYHAYHELNSKEEHEITVKQLCRLIGYHGNNHSAIKDALKELIATVIEWNVVSDETGDENWTASSILASVSLEGPLCYYAYSPRMKQLLHSPSMFGKIDLVIQSRFRSSYGLALYENCIRYRGLPQTKWFDIELFKKLMGIPKGKYTIFRDFKRRVLDKAIDEVNMYSDLIVEPEYVREGRKVTRLRFKLKDRAKKTRLGKSIKKLAKVATEEILNVQKTLTEDFALSEEQATQLTLEFDVNFIQEKIQLVLESRPYKEGKVQNLTAYLLSAVRNNYQPATAQKAEVVQIQDAKKDIELAETKRHVEAIRKRYQIYREDQIQQAIELLEGDKRDELMTAFKQFVEPAVHTILKLQSGKYTIETVYESPQIKSLLRSFALRELDLIPIMPFDEYAMSQTDKDRAAWQKLKSIDPENHLLRGE